MIVLKNYQERAIDELHSKLKKYLNYEGVYTISFKAPTGSGKTLMVAEALMELVNDITLGDEISFVWISVRSLHEQSKKKLDEILDGRKILTCSFFDGLLDNRISDNEILFINWESINKKDTNIIIKDNEKDNNLNNVVANTKNDGRKIILIIDESHHTANTEQSRNLISLISPDVTLEVSATPISKNYDDYVTIPLAEVKAEQMIKSEVSVNPDFMGLEVGEKSSDEILLESAINTRNILLEKLKAEGSLIKPLILVQLPDKAEGTEDKKDIILKMLDTKFNVNEDNGKLAIWLSDDKTPSLVNIEKGDSNVEILIFKQAISLGWDCPRASILVIFRELKSFTFTIQTVGRIMRMPEFKYYKAEELNKAYVFTNLPNVIIEGDEFKPYVTVYDSHRNNKNYENIKLKSVSVKRLRERTRLSGEFVRIFQDVAKAENIAEKLTKSPTSIADFIIADGKIENVDKVGEIESEGSIVVSSTSSEIDRKFLLFIIKNCSPYAPIDSSDRMRNALYTFVNENFGIEKYSTNAQALILGTENIAIFESAINTSKEVYQRDIVEKLERKGEFIEDASWEIPQIISYNDNYHVFISQKSIMQPFYKYKDASGPEVKFMKTLENSHNVKWWFKNRENEPKYFSIGYVNEDGYNSAFYVDFIVQFIDGTIGLFDTKLGSTAKEDAAKLKAEALYKYVNEEKVRDRKFRGGIIIPANSEGTLWKINENSVYTDDFNNPSSWKFLQI